MNNYTTMNNTTKNGLLFAALVFGVLVPSGRALPNTGTWNLQTTPGVSVDIQGNTAVFTAPDRAILNWNNFGSGTDTISAGETLNYVLPGASASVLNIVSGSASTTINGTIESNGGVFILNPNGVILGNGARIDTQALYISAADNPFAAQLQFAQDGTVPTQKGTRTAAGSVIISGDAAIASPNATVVGRDVTINALLAGGNLTINADGNVQVGSAVGLTYVGGNLAVTNSGLITVGSAGSFTMVKGGAALESKNSNIVVPAGSDTRAGTVTARAVVGDVILASINASGVNVSAKNASVTFNGTAGVSVAGNITGNIAVTSPGFTSVDGLNVTGTGTTSVTAGAVLTLNKLHVTSDGATTLTGSYVRDNADGLFVYGQTNLVATAGDISVTKANHSFGPLSLAAAQGTATVTESGTINLNAVNTKELTLRTGGGFFQTPGTYGLLTQKFALTAVDSVAFSGGTISNGLTVNAGTANVDLGKLNLVTNLNSVAPVVVTTGTVVPPAQ